MIATGSGENEERELSATAERFCRQFSLDEIQLATRDFNDGNLIGKGGFGKVYKGQIHDGQQTVAMKRLAPNSNQGEGEFLTEIETLSKLRHVNLVSLIGYCNQNGEMILVYEYIPRGMLADHLYKLSGSSESDDCSSLAWKQRLNICIEAARGIDYLHTGTSVIHRDVKSTNILLDENLTAKISDFGLAKHLGTISSKSHVSTIVKGSFGYLDPSYFTTGRLTRKSDTYAFGVVLLEVLCGRPAVDQRLGEDEMSLVMWAQEKFSKGNVDQIVASNLRDGISDDCLKTFVGIAKRCLNHNPKERPTMAQVVAQLEFALEQQDKKVPTPNASRFRPFWNIVKPSGSRAIGPTQKDHKCVDVNTLSTAFRSREDKLTVNVLPNVFTAIPIHELKDITNNFSSKCLIGKDLYRGALKSGQVAVIKMIRYRRKTNKTFLAQVSLESSLKHKNVAQLLGYSLDGRRQFLAYEFAQNASLYDILHGQQGAKGSKPAPSLSWGQRAKIAMGAAKGLEYIHDKGPIRCNIRSSNILVYDANVAKLAYFCQTFDDSPKYPGHYDLSRRTDVYYFGLVLLQLLTGNERFEHARPTGSQAIVNWAKSWLRKDTVKDFVDARLHRDYPREAVAKMAAITASCLENDAGSRPEMSCVVRALLPLCAMETQNLLMELELCE